MPSFSNSLSGSLISNVYAYCEVKQSWSGQWQLVPYLTPLEISQQSGSTGIGKARLEYQFGNITRELQPGFVPFQPQTLVDNYVRISTQADGAAPEVQFVGVIVEQTTTYGSPTDLKGSQQFDCYELGYLLDREQVLSTRVCEADDQETTPQEIRRVVAFNERSHRGNSLLGNRTTDTTTDKVYAFKSNGQLWSYTDIINYLLKYYAPGPMKWKLTGQTSPLDSIQTVFDPKGETVWGCLRKLIDNRRSLDFQLQVGSDGSIQVQVFSHSDIAIQIGGETLPANLNQISLDVPTDYPYSHLVDDVPFGDTSANTYDKIVVQGNQIVQLATFSFMDGTLIKGWSDALENEYLAAADPTDETKNDTFRESTRYDSVYSTFKVPRNWNFSTGDGTGNVLKSNFANCAPNPQEDGTVSWSGTQGPHWIGQQHFERQLPLRKDFDYTKSPPVDNTVTDTEDEFLLPLVIYFDAGVQGANPPNHTPDKKWHEVHKLGANQSGIKNMSVRILENEMGFDVNVSPNHYLALGWWNQPGNVAKPSTVEPELNYQQLAITAAFKTDMRQNVVLYNQSGQTETKKTLTITLDHAEFWHAASTATILIGTDGIGRLINPNNLTIRDDGKLLKAVASYAAAWYGVKRQKVSLKFQNVGTWAPIGSLITSISSIYQTEQVRTVVTSRTIDFRNRTTTLETGYRDLDFASFGSKFRDS